MDAKNVKTVDVAKKQLESHVDEQVHKADKDNKQKVTARAETKESETTEVKPREVPVIKSKMKQTASEGLNGEKHQPA